MKKTYMLNQLCTLINEKKLNQNEIKNKTFFSSIDYIFPLLNRWSFLGYGLLCFVNLIITGHIVIKEVQHKDYQTKADSLKTHLFYNCLWWRTAVNTVKMISEASKWSLLLSHLHFPTYLVKLGKTGYFEFVIIMSMLWLQTNVFKGWVNSTIVVALREIK